MYSHIIGNALKHGQAMVPGKASKPAHIKAALKKRRPKK